jgi:hypothetical protein
MNAAESIPKAWHELVAEPDSLLMDLIAEKAESLCGYRPASEDVEAFLVNGLQAPNRSALAMHGISVDAKLAKPSSAPISERGVTYSIFGERRSASTAIDALIDILRTLAGRNSNFLQKLSPAVRGRSRNHIARSRSEVYPNKPELEEYTAELTPGWWLGTNIANRDKMRIVEKACETEGLSLGRDISISLPNA